MAIDKEKIIMKKNRYLSFLMAVVMLVSVAVCGTGTAFAENAAAAETSMVDQQLNLIYSQLDKMMQNDGRNTWYYCVTDLDHDGNLELIAASLHPQDRSTNVKIWEVSGDGTALIECGLAKDEDESFPDIMTESADAFYNRETDTWNYLVYDNIVISDTEVYTIETSVSLKDGVLGYNAHAIEHTVLENAYRSVSYTDVNGFVISQEQYSRSATDAFAGMERSNAAFEWLTAEDVVSLSKLTDSYMVFAGQKQPTETFPVPKPAALLHPEATPTPAATAQPRPAAVPQQDVFLMITKNPTNENRKVGTNAVFVACANAFESLTWTFVSPEGGEYTPRNFIAGSGAGLTGENSTTLTVTGVESWMDGWAAYCTFYYKGQVARTSYAYICINNPAPVKPTPTPKPAPVQKAYYGTVADWSYDFVTVRVDGYGNIGIRWSVCYLEGEPYIGAPAMLYWTGRNSDAPTYCEIAGMEPEPEPVYGSMNGIAYHGNAYEIYLELNNGSNIYVDGMLVNIIGGMEIEGASCTVYYTDSPTPENIYRVDVYGYDVDYDEPEPEPVYGTMNGTAYHGNAYEIYLELNNGSNIYVDGMLVNIIGGMEIEGAPCMVYYIDSPTPENIYQVDVYGYDVDYDEPAEVLEPEAYEVPYADPDPYVEPDVEPEPYVDPYEEDDVSADPVSVEEAADEAAG